jgi:glyoxylase-like metal-dependent hydrolase (beta-lactamase superfamily II)
LPDLTPEILDEHRSWLEPAALEQATGKLIFCFQSYLVRTPHHVVLIDSCVGNDKNRPTRPSWHMKTDQAYMSALASAGIAVGDIDYVMCTHLHPDHVGWNTRLENGRWVPTFPNARYVFCRSSRQSGQSWSAAIMPSTIMSDCCRRPGIRPTISPCSSASPVPAPS